MTSAEQAAGQESSASANEHTDNSRLISARQRAIDLAINRHIDGKIYPQQPTKLEQRLQRRLQQEQLQRQENLEKIMQIAASLCQDTLATESDP
ncbi:MAG TPA: hypothetical protein DCF97_05305, partial [Plesiomonas shigelloides]|nr:hypothetical protein [Plesiomonas shigelloides]